MRAIASNVQEVGKLLETGFEYVCSFNGEMLFKKRRRRIDPMVNVNYSMELFRHG